MKNFTDLQFSSDAPNCIFLGRNGQFKAKGLALTKCADSTIIIEPRTSKGRIGRAMIEFPVSAIPEVVKFLNQFV